MTTTENAEECHPGDSWKSDIGRPMVDWLLANDVDLDRIPMFPDIELLPGRARIQHFYGREKGGEGRSNLIFNQLGMRMVELPIPVPITPELWDAYQEARDNYRAEQALRILGDSGATVVAVRPGASLIFVSGHPLDGETSDGRTFAEMARDELTKVLPGVQVTLMGGVETILHQAARGS